MITRMADRVQVSGNITMATVSAIFREGLLQQKNNAANTALIIDFSGLEKVDSSAVSLMLAWLREAQRDSVSVRFENVPDNLLSLAKLYGVAEMFELQHID